MQQRKRERRVRKEEKRKRERERAKTIKQVKKGRSSKDIWRSEKEANIARYL